MLVEPSNEDVYAFKVFAYHLVECNICTERGMF
jgi:hypothetical protein